MTALDTATSSFLLAHKDNPVQWRLWSSDLFAEAEATGKPILLSIGYAACHWCHVMNRESFSNPDIAKLINDNFIPVILDRVQRPDIDQMYQAASNLMGHQGGWPLNIFLTPQGRPFFVGGYLPDIEKLQDAGLLGRTGAAMIEGDSLAAELRSVLGFAAVEEEREEDAA